MPNIFDLHANLQVLLSDLEGEVDIDTASFHEALDAITTERDKKLDTIVEMIHESEANHDARLRQAERMLERAKAARRATVRIKSFLEYWFKATGTKRVETDRFTISIQKNGGERPLRLTAEVPDKFTHTVSKVVPDQDKIRKALDSNQTLPFAEYGERGTHIRLK